MTAIGNGKIIILGGYSDAMAGEDKRLSDVLIYDTKYNSLERKAESNKIGFAPSIYPTVLTPRADLIITADVRSQEVVAYNPATDYLSVVTKLPSYVL